MGLQTADEHNLANKAPPTTTKRKVFVREVIAKCIQVWTVFVLLYLFAFNSITSLTSKYQFQQNRIFFSDH